MATTRRSKELGSFAGIRLPENRLQIDEEAFLRLLAGCVSLMKTEKRKIIEAIPRMSQCQVDELMALMAAELEEIRRREARRGEEWERVRQLQATWWEELTRELGH